MSAYVEIMCDLRLEGFAPGSLTRPRCLSDENANPQGSSIGEARRRARFEGWHRSRALGDICPGCIDGVNQ